MADHGTAIEWTQSPGYKGETWNPVTGCDRVSPGCAHCYALDLAARLKGMGQKRYQRDGDPKTSGPGFGLTLHPDKLEQPLRWRKPRMVFVNSMSDLFHEEISNEFVLAVWAVMEAAPQHIYMVLTKRPERMHQLLGGVAPMVTSPRPPYDRRSVPGLPEIEVDTLGQVWSLRGGSEKRLTPERSQKRHERVRIYRRGQGGEDRLLVHRVVLEVFDRPPRGGEQGCHRDGNPANNAIENLYWGTQVDNWQDSKRHGTDRRHHRLVAREVAELRIGALQGESGAALGRRFGISDTQARNIIRGDQWGFKQLPSVWLGVTIENRRFVHRADLLRETPAAVRFISAEPLLGPLLIADWRDAQPGEYGRWADGFDGPQLELTAIDWLIAGGESGPRNRPVDLQWVRDLRDAAIATGTKCSNCKGAGFYWRIAEDTGGEYPATCDDCRGCGATQKTTAFFFKQWGGATPKAGGRELDGRTWGEWPAALEAGSV